ncbi:MAG: hypothetical protein KAY29_03240 [Brevundimonas sp.]|jgi:hypothetical protein|nr:hypothetical protein [Brevundimonas sp.]
MGALPGGNPVQRYRVSNVAVQASGDFDAKGATIDFDTGVRHGASALNVNEAHPHDPALNARNLPGPLGECPRHPHRKRCHRECSDADDDQCASVTELVDYPGGQGAQRQAV